MKDKIIVIEGACDGIGKTTQFNLLKQYLEENGTEVVSHHYPSYNTIQGKLVEEYLSGHLGKISDLSPYLVNSLYAIDRAITWESDLKDKAKGKVLLLDRYTTSSLIYQTALIDNLEEKKQAIDYIVDYEYNKLGIPKPDLVIFLKAPYDLIKKLRTARLTNEGIAHDIHEEDDSFMRRVYNNAVFISNYLNWQTVDCNEGDELLTIDEVHKKIRKIIK